MKRRWTFLWRVRLPIMLLMKPGLKTTDALHEGVGEGWPVVAAPNGLRETTALRFISEKGDPFPGG